MVKLKIIGLFVGICLVIRCVLTYIAKIIPLKYLPIMGVIYLVFAIGFFHTYISQSRTKGILNQPAWWDGMRPVHGGLFLIFAITALLKYKDAWIILLIDTILGGVAFTIYHTCYNK